MPAFSPDPTATRYVAVLTQAGEGCDYTIACGTKVVDLDATSPPAAVEAAKELAHGYRGDNALKSLKILAVVGTLNAPLTEWYAKFDRDREDLARQLADIEERDADLAALRQLEERLGLKPRDI